MSKVRDLFPEEEEPAMFTTEWRMLQVEKGQEAMAMAETLTDPQLKIFYMLKCQAYWQAANIRSRPGESAKKEKGNLWYG